jgi:hypothetical protein
MLLGQVFEKPEFNTQFQRVSIRFRRRRRFTWAPIGCHYARIDGVNTLTKQPDRHKEQHRRSEHGSAEMLDIRVHHKVYLYLS